MACGCKKRAAVLRNAAAKAAAGDVNRAARSLELVGRSMLHDGQAALANLRRRAAGARLAARSGRR